MSSHTPEPEHEDHTQLRLQEAVPKPARWTAFEQCSNFRDLGGYPTGAGRQTRWGLVYRSGLLHTLTPADLVTFGQLGVRTVFDLRTATERESRPSPVVSLHVPLADDLSTSELMEMLDVRSAAEAEDAVVRMYTSTLDRRPEVLGRLLTQLADGTNLPAVFHCTAGKDRTGLVAALLLSALGADRKTVVEDYALTGQRLPPDSDAYRPALLGAGVPEDAVRIFLGASPRSMERALGELDRQYGGPLQYLIGPAGVEPAALDELRLLLTEPVGDANAEPE